MATENAKFANLKPKAHQDPVVYVLTLMTSPELKDAQIRVSRDVNSAQSFAAIYQASKFHFNYTVVPIKNVRKPPVPDQLYLLVAQRTKQNIGDIAIGAYQTQKEAEDQLKELQQNTLDMVELAKKSDKSEEDDEKLNKMRQDPHYGYSIFTIKLCIVQFGLSEEEKDFLKSEMKQLKKSVGLE